MVRPIAAATGTEGTRIAPIMGRVPPSNVPASAVVPAAIAAYFCAEVAEVSLVG